MHKNNYIIYFIYSITGVDITCLTLIYKCLKIPNGEHKLLNLFIIFVLKGRKLWKMCLITRIYS